MANISVIDGTLYQWNSGRKIRIVPRQGETINRVHYNNGNVVFLSEDGDSIVAPIPNILLKSSQNITAYVEVVSAEGVRTVSDCTFSVIAKPKPDDYVYEETEVLTIEAVVENALNEAKESGEFDGNDGYTPQKGVDYWNDDDKAEIEEYIDEKTEIIKSDLEGIQQQINEEAHFRGYESTNTNIQELQATPNDFVYSAESGTVWIYDMENGWQDSGKPVPDKSTPLSNHTPLINGASSSGQSEEAARSDHRHPTDTTRVSVEEFNTFKGDLGTALDRIIDIQNSLIGGDAS